MYHENPVEKSCGSQLLPVGDPTSEWGIDHLGVYAQLQYRLILDGEKSLTAVYWRLGRALAFAKQIFKHGCWGQYLKDLGIDKTRASKATAIHKTFGKEEDVARLRVDEAYARRERKKVKKQTDSDGENAAAKKDAKTLRRSIGNIARQTGAAIHNAAYAGPQEAVILIPAVRKAIRELVELLRFLEEQAAKAPVDAPSLNSTAPQSAGQG
jgi:hypothetical protein